jgi:hypothetical protein
MTDTVRHTVARTACAVATAPFVATDASASPSDVVATAASAVPVAPAPAPVTVISIDAPTAITAMVDATTTVAPTAIDATKSAILSQTLLPFLDLPSAFCH